jgi:two-component system chemotaxis sensor kinase CheA
MPAAAEMDPELCYLGFEIALESSADKQAIEDIFAFVRDECQLAILPPNSKVADYLELIRDLPEDPLRLGEILVRVGALTADELADGLRAQSLASDEPAPEALQIGEILVAQQVVQPELVAAAVAKQAQVSEKKAQDAKLIRVPADKLDHLINLVGELVIAGASHQPARPHPPRRRADRSVVPADPAGGGNPRRLAAAAHGADRRNLQPLPAPGARRLRTWARMSLLVINGGETELDKSIVEKIGDPLMHLVRNSMDHGIEHPPCARPPASRPQGTL